MMQRRLALVALCFAGCATPEPSSGALKAGAARVDITPDVPIRLSGYSSRKTPSEGVEAPLFARAFAFEDDRGGRALILQADAIAVSWEITEEVARRLAPLVPRERLALAVTHTHSAPGLTGVIRNILDLADEEKKVVDAYTRRFIDRLVDAGHAALRDLAPATLERRRSRAGFAANRRTPGGPVDHDVPVLRVCRPDGRLRAVLFGYACHCTTVSLNKVGGDWAGFAQEALEKDGVVAGALIGCGADSNPTPRGSYEHARRYGGDLAAAVLQALPVGAVRGTIEGRLSRVDLPFDTLPTLEQLRETAEKHERPEERRRARMLLEKPLSPSLPLPVQALVIGSDLCFVFLGGEVVIDHQLRLKRTYDPARIWAVAYANDVPAYIPSERVLAEGGYEGGGAMLWYGHPAKFAKGIEEILHQKIGELVPSAFQRASNP